MTAPVSQVLSEAEGSQYGAFQLVSGKRPDGLSDDETIMTHEVTRGWGSRPFIRKVSEIEWRSVFGIRRAAALAKEQGR